INQHWGYDLPEVERASAGCLVGQSKNGHREFMAIVKSDPCYQANRKCVFATTIQPESDVLAEGPTAVPLPHVEPELPPVPSDVSDDVRRWQKLLGFSEEQQDGIFGAITEEAVKRFQRCHGLPVNGDMDGKTRDALEHEAAGPVGDSPTVETQLAEPETPVQPEVKQVIPDSPSVIPSVIPGAIIPGVLPTLLPKLLVGVGTMNPLIGLAVTVLP